MLACLPLGAQAATPRPGAILEEHRHGSRGTDWHVQVEVNRASTRLTSVVVYSQECGETGFAVKVPLGERGAFAVSDSLPDQQGAFYVKGRFVTADRAIGSWEISTPTCTFGGEFRARDASGHFLVGNPYEYAPQAIKGTSRNARRLRALKYRSRIAARRFDTPAEARRRGYVLSTAAGCPGMNHARKRGTRMWGRVLDPRAPQSLVFWCNKRRRWTLAGYMFRAPGGRRPPTFGNLMQWHKHGSSRSATWMAHLWLVPDSIDAFATCVPFRAFAAERMFRFRPFLAPPGDEPCSDTPGL